MTEPTPFSDDSPDFPHSEVDDIVSAVLDGEATPAEVERVQGDPQLRERLAEFEVVQGQVAAPVSGLDELTQRRLTATAVAVAKPAASAQPITRHEAPWWRRNAWGVGSAAAVVLLALLVGPVLVDQMSTGEDDMASVAGDADSASQETLDAPSFEAAGGGDSPDQDDGDEAGARPEAALPDASEAGGVPTDADLPVYTDIASFEDALRARHAERATDDSPEPTVAFAADYSTPVEEFEMRCGPQLLDDDFMANRSLVGQARGLVEGERLIAVVFIAADGSTGGVEVVVIDPVACSVVN